MPLPPLLAVKDIHERLQAIFPEGTATDTDMPHQPCGPSSVSATMSPVCGSFSVSADG